MVKSVDTRDLKSLAVKSVPVRVRLPAPNQYNPNQFFPFGDWFGLFVYFQRNENVSLYSISLKTIFLLFFMVAPLILGGKLQNIKSYGDLNYHSTRVTSRTSKNGDLMDA